MESEYKSRAYYMKGCKKHDPLSEAQFLEKDLNDCIKCGVLTDAEIIKRCTEIQILCAMANRKGKDS